MSVINSIVEDSDDVVLSYYYTINARAKILTQSCCLLSCTFFDVFHFVVSSILTCEEQIFLFASVIAYEHSIVNIN